ncbi:MAG: Rid family detoxifying hydrolase [Vicinamibacterales bacterium]
MTHKPVHAANLPKPVGPYSPGMGFERLIFVSGQGATDPATGELAGHDVTTQTEQCLKNLQAILKAGGSDLQHVLRCGVFLLDMTEFQKMNAVYSRMFGEHRPARTTIQAAGLPGEGLLVEIDCIAYVPEK